MNQSLFQVYTEHLFVEQKKKEETERAQRVEMDGESRMTGEDYVDPSQPVVSKPPEEHYDVSIYEPPKLQFLLNLNIGMAFFFVGVYWLFYSIR